MLYSKFRKTRFSPERLVQLHGYFGDKLHASRTNVKGDEELGDLEALDEKVELLRDFSSCFILQVHGNAKYVVDLNWGKDVAPTMIVLKTL